MWTNEVKKQMFSTRNTFTGSFRDDEPEEPAPNKPCSKRFEENYNECCDIMFAPHTEKWWPMRCPPRKHIISNMLARLDPNAYNPFDEFYVLHEANTQGCDWCFGFNLIGVALTLALIATIGYYTYLMYSDYSQNFAPVVRYFSGLDSDYSATIGDTSSSSSVGQVYVAFINRLGEYLSPDAATFAVAFSQVNKALNGTATTASSLTSTTSSVSVFGSGPSISAASLGDTTTLSGAPSLDNSSPAKVVRIEVTAGSSTSYSSFLSTYEGGSFVVFQQFLGNDNIEDATNPAHWEVARFPLSDQTTTYATITTQRQIISLNNQWRYMTSSSDLWMSGSTTRVDLSVTEAQSAIGTSDLLFVADVELDPIQVLEVRQRFSLFDYMSLVGGTAFLATLVVAMVTYAIDQNANETFKPRKSAFERLIRKKKEELEYYREMLLLNPRVAKEANMTPGQLNDYLKYKQGQELALLVKALEVALLFKHPSRVERASPLDNVRQALRDEFGDAALAKVDFEYSNEEVSKQDKRTDGSYMARVVNIIQVVKLRKEVEEIDAFLKTQLRRWREESLASL